MKTRRTLVVLSALALVGAACEGPRDREVTTLNNRPGPGATTGTTVPGEDPPPAPIIDATQCSSDPTTGIDGDTIKFGMSLPQSGLLAAFDEIREGAEAYFEYVNEELGGVEIAGKQYQIELVALNDEYNPQKTASNVEELINAEKVFGLFNVVGTRNNLAIRDLVQEQCVPNLFAGTGSPAWGNPDYSFTLGTALVPYSLEAKAFADYLKANKPDATVAVLHASDDFGRAYLETFEQEIEGTDIEIVAEKSYNPDDFNTQSQVTSLAASDADAFLLAATLLGCPNSLSAMKSAGWDPIVYMSGTCTSKTIIELSKDGADGVFSVAPLLDPANPATHDVPGMALYLEEFPKRVPESADRVDNSIIAYGWTSAALLVDILGRSPAADRISVMETARTSTFGDVGVMIPGTTMEVNADDWYLAETFNLVQFDYEQGFFEVVSETPIDENGNALAVTPEGLVFG